MITPKNILIVRTDRIGDVVLTLPMAEILKHKFPSCTVSFLVNKYTANIVRKNKFIDKVIALEQSNKKIFLWKNIKILKNQNFDTTFVVSPKFLISLIIFLSRIKTRIGTGYRWYSFLFNNKVYEHRKSATKHELEYNIGLLKAIGINFNASTDNISFNFVLNEEEKNEIKTLLKQNGIKDDKPIIIVHPGSAGSSVDLPTEKITLLAKKINELIDCNVVLTGNGKEEKLCEEIQKESGSINLAGRLSLSQLIALISVSDIFIGNSTGPLHIAAALNKYVIGFYPKIKTCSAKRWGPYTDKKFIFEPTIKCENCNREQCRALDCMNTINIAQVIQTVQSVCFKLKESYEKT